MKTIVRIVTHRLVWRLLSAVAMFLLVRDLKSVRREVKQMQQNQEYLLQSQEAVLLSNERTARQSGVLSLQQNEILNLLPELKKELETIKVKQSQSASKLAFRTQKRIVLSLSDSADYARNGIFIIHVP